MMKWFTAISPKHLSFAVLTLLFLSLCGYYFKGHKQQAQTAIAVSINVATRGNLTPEITTIGTAVAMQTVAIKSQVAGQLAQVLVKSGQGVKAGDVLFSINPASFNAAVNQATALLNKDQALAVYALQELTRYTTLAQQGFIAKEFFSQILANAKTAQATVKADQAAVNSAALLLSYCTIKAPISGRLGNIVPKVGDLILANDPTPMVTINQFQPIEVQFSLPSTNIDLVKQALTNSAVHVSATSLDDQRLKLTGTIDFIDNQIDPATSSIILKASFANTNAAMWPGQLIQITVDGAINDHVILIPSEAIRENQQGQFYVYVIDSAQKAHLQLITVGASLDHVTAVLQGLKAGDLVVTAGQFRLTDGQLTTHV